MTSHVFHLRDCVGMLTLLWVAFTTKLKAKSRSKLILDFEHDCFRYLFYGKERQSRNDTYLLLENMTLLDVSL